MTKHLLSAFSLLMATGVAAQQPIVVSIGGGFNSTSSNVKTNAQVGNGYNLQGDVFIPFLRKGWDGTVKGGSKFALGVIAGGSYLSSKNLVPDAATTQAAYKLYSGSLDVSNQQKGTSTNNGFTASAGLQADFTFGPFTLSPSFSGGYFSVKQNGFAQGAMLDSKPILLSQSPKTNNKGFIAVPQIRLKHKLTDQLGIYTAASLLMGPEITTKQYQLMPSGGFNDKHTYEPMQLSRGTMTEKSASTNYRALQVNAGLSWNFGKSSRRLKGKVIKTSDNGARQENPIYNPSGSSGENPLYGSSGMAKPGQPIGGIVVKGGKNPGGSMRVASTDSNGQFELTGLEAGHYQFMLSLPETLQAKSINEKGIKRSDAEVSARPGQPIGGIVVKGGKNPGGSMTNLTVGNNGLVQFEVLEAGDYRFIIQTAETTEGSGEKKKKVEKASSGLKDTVRTNV